MTGEEILYGLYWLSLKDPFYGTMLGFLRCDKEEAVGLLEYMAEQNFQTLGDIEKYFD